MVSKILEIAKGKTARFEVQGDFAFEDGVSTGATVTWRTS